MLKAAGADLDTLDDATDRARLEQPGQRTVGRPDLSLGAEDPVIMGVDEVRDPGEETFEQWNEAAAAMLASDYEGTVRRVMEYGRTGGQLSPELTRAAQLIVARESRKKQTPAQQRRMQWLVWSYRLAGTEQARGLAARRDPFKTPAERHREFLMRVIYTPPPAVRKAIEQADGFAEKQKLMEAQSREIEKIKAELARMGISLDDLFGGEVALVLKNDPIVKALTGGMDAKRKAAVGMLQDGKSFKDIARATGLDVSTVTILHAEMRAKANDAVMEKLRAMRAKARSWRDANSP